MKKHLSFLLASLLLAIIIIIPVSAYEEVTTPIVETDSASARADPPEADVITDPNSEMLLTGFRFGGARVQNLILSNQYQCGMSNYSAIWTNGLGNSVYCIEPCAATSSGTVYGSSTKDILNQSPYVCHAITTADDKERLIGTILNYGSLSVSNPPSNEESLLYLATQILIHEVVLEERDANFTYIGAKAGCSAVKDSYVFTSSDFSNHFTNLYNQIVTQVQLYYTIPSFCASTPGAATTFTLDQYDENTHEYYTNLTDNNNVCGTYFPAGYKSGDLVFTPFNGGHNMRVATSKTDFSSATAQDGRDQPIQGLVYWGNSSAQQMCQCAAPTVDPVNAYCKFQIGNGTLVLHKLSEVYDWQSKQSHYENGANISFQVVCGSYSTTGTTDGNGNVSFSNLPAGTYTIKELNVPDSYVAPDDQKVIVKPAQTSAAEFVNLLKRSKVGLVNRCTYYGAYLSGAEFEIYTADGVDTGISLTADAHNWVYSDDLVYGDYYIKQTKEPEYYALQEETYPFSIKQNNNTVQVETWNTPLSDVYPEFVTPNSAYREDTEVVASYMIHNDSIAEHAPARPLTVNQLTVHFTASLGDKVIDSQTKKIDVPMFNQQLTYFRFKVPSGSSGQSIQLKCEVEVPDGVVETDLTDKVITQDFTIQSVPTSDTPDTTFETLPSDFVLPSSATPAPTAGIVDNPTQSSQWEMWDYNGGDWKVQTYSVSLSTTENLSPDSAVPSYDSANLKSGYGVVFTSTAAVTSDNGLPLGDSCTSAQHGNLYFPEFEYSDKSGQYRDLECVAENQFAIKQNPYSTTSDGSSDNRRVHFVPLWFPDNTAYTVKTFVYDCWTPAGMISLQSTPPSLNIQGNMYDDWYISHTN